MPPVFIDPALTEYGRGKGASGNVFDEAIRAFLKALQDIFAAAATDAGDALGGIFSALNATVGALGNLVRDLLRAANRADLAGQIDTSGDLFAFVGSLQDAIIDRAKLTSGALTFEEVLVYADRLEGMRTIVVLVSFVFSIAVDVLALGQQVAPIGLLLHLIDDVVGDASRLVSTQLVRRAVGDPLADGYKLVHRTGLLSSSAAAKAYELGMIDDDELVDALVHDGLNDRAVQVLTQLARVARLANVGEIPVRTKLLTQAQGETLTRAKIWTEAQYVALLGKLGYTDDAIKDLVRLATEKKPILGGTTGA